MVERLISVDVENLGNAPVVEFGAVSTLQTSR